MAEFDVIVIGGGPGGYVAAIRAAQLGKRVACIEGRETLGGTCLNVGCIPSKALLHATAMLHEATHNFAAMGLKGPAPEPDWPAMQAYKQKIVDGNTQGIDFLFKKNKVTRLKGWAKLLAPGVVELSGDTHNAKEIILATGSEPAVLRGVEVDEKVIVTSTGALAAGKVPKRLIVIGAGVIGLELGSVYARLGTEVTVLEYLDGIAPGMDGEVCKGLQRLLARQGLNFVLGVAVEGAAVRSGKAKVAWKARKDGASGTAEAEMVLVATGRRPFTAGLGLEAAGVLTDERGFIPHDGHGRSNVPGIWVIGDVTTGPMLAHKAEDEGIAVAETIAGQAGHVNYSVIPGVIYTDPEVASVGLTEEALKSAGRPYKSGKFPFMGNARAKAHFAGDGFVKLLADAASDRILGAHIIGPSAGDLIHEVCVAMEFGASAEDLARTTHAHPTFSEAVREAALACGSGAIHA
jgi:dihydrolipoamide dehydrogenase